MGLGSASLALPARGITERSLGTHRRQEASGEVC